jgi:hypothetical protein
MKCVLLCVFHMEKNPNKNNILNMYTEILKTYI